MTGTTRKVPALVSATLVEPVDLPLLAKQLDRVIGGQLLRPLHEQLGELAEIGCTHAAVVADRYVPLGATPDGRSRDVAPASRLDLVEAALIGNLVVVEVDVRMRDLLARHIHNHIVDPGSGIRGVLTEASRAVGQRFLLHADRRPSPVPIWR